MTIIAIESALDVAIMFGDVELAEIYTEALEERPLRKPCQVLGITKGAQRYGNGYWRLVRRTVSPRH